MAKTFHHARAKYSATFRWNGRDFQVESDDLGTPCAGPACLHDGCRSPEILDIVEMGGHSVADELMDDDGWFSPLYSAAVLALEGLRDA